MTNFTRDTRDTLRMLFLEENRNLKLDAISGATEGFLGQRVVPDAISGASAI